MRYKVEQNCFGWYISDTATDDPNEQIFLWASKTFPDAEKMVRDQCLFLNESPAMKAA